MKKSLFLFVLLSFTIPARTQPFSISFAGSGASATVTSVMVENLTTGATVTLNGEDILRLTMATGIQTGEMSQKSRVRIYPNPVSDISTIEISPPSAGYAFVSIYDITGKQLHQKRSFLDRSVQRFEISGLGSGIHLLDIRGSDYQLSGKMVSKGNSPGKVNLIKMNENQFAKDIKPGNEIKGSPTIVDMEYKTGERLKFTGKSGSYATVTTIIPTADQTITFNFISCTDADNNNYAVVTIGTQIWMAENLRTTKYRNSDNIPLVTDNAAWNDLITPAYCWYENYESSYKNIYGALYNWYTVVTGNLCPTGWHIPAKDDWLTLVNSLGGYIEAGGPLKETGTAHWITPNKEASNLTGFTGLPGGNRHYGSFSGIGYNGIFFSATESTSTSFWSTGLYFGSVSASLYESLKKDGFSVRCIKD